VAAVAEAAVAEAAVDEAAVAEAAVAEAAVDEAVVDEAAVDEVPEFELLANAVPLAPPGAIPGFGSLASAGTLSATNVLQTVVSKETGFTAL
jgi:hypothetical protein